MFRTVLAAALLMISCSHVASPGAGPGAGPGAAQVATESAEVAVVRAFIDAFNDHDPEAMLSFCNDDMRWGFVDGVSVSVEADGRQQMIAQMQDYFSQVPDVRSAAEGFLANGDTVAVTERVTWKKDGEAQSQSSLSVYQFKDGKVYSVLYFPVQN